MRAAFSRAAVWISHDSHDLSKWVRVMVLHDVVSHPGAIFVPLTPTPWKVSNIPLANRYISFRYLSNHCWNSKEKVEMWNTSEIWNAVMRCYFSEKCSAIIRVHILPEYHKMSNLQRATFMCLRITYILGPIRIARKRAISVPYLPFI